MQTFNPVIRWWSLVNLRLIAHFTETLEIHADRLMYRKGILNKSEIVIPFSKISNYSADQNLCDRIFGVGNFRIETSGSSIAPELMLIGYSYALRDIIAQSVKANKG